MNTRSLQLVILTALCLFWQSCDDTSVEPGPFNYPIELEVNGSSSNVSLSWTEVKVSTFEEYIVIRSIEDIPDTQEPEVVGNQVIIARLDEIDETTFTDFATPFEPKLYYKVFADIGDRFLSSATVEVTQPLQIVEYRTDVVEPATDKDQIIGFDRSLDILYVYDYSDREMLTQRAWGFNTPIIRTGNYNNRDEIYSVDLSQSTLYVFDKNNLQVLTQFSMSSGVADFFFANGLFFIAYTNGTVQVRSRSNFQQLGQQFSISGSRVLYLLSNDASGIEFVEIGFTAIIKYKWLSNALTVLSSRSDISGSSQLITAVHPDKSEFIINNTGRVLKSNLEDRGSLGSGLQFHNACTYSDDGSIVATVGFVGNSNTLSFYGTDENYPLKNSNDLSFTPTKMWGDNDRIYTSTVVFISGGVRSVIKTFDLP